MAKDLIFHRQSDFSYGITPSRPSQTAHPHVCPPWLLKKYKQFKIYYLFDAKTNQPADLETVKRLATGEWAAVYVNKVVLLDNRHHGWTERYTWVWRNGKMVELSQSGARPSFGRRRSVVVTRFK